MKLRTFMQLMGMVALLMTFNIVRAEQCVDPWPDIMEKQLPHLKSKIDSEQQELEDDVNASIQSNEQLTEESKKGHELKTWFGRTDFSLDLPEFTAVQENAYLDLPQVTMRQRRLSFHAPSMCQKRISAHVPKTYCEDTWISLPFGGKTKGVPKCRVVMERSESTISEPCMIRREVIVGVPDFHVSTTSIKVPNIRMVMRTRNLSLDLPQIHDINHYKKADEAKGNLEKLNEFLEESTSKIKSEDIKAFVLSVDLQQTNHMECHKSNLNTVKTNTTTHINAALAQIDNSIAEIQASTNGQGEAASVLETLRANRAMLVAKNEEVSSNVGREMKKIQKASDEKKNIISKMLSQLEA